MKKIAFALALCLPLIASAALPQTVFDGPEARVKVLDTPGNHPLRRGDMVVFTAETIFKVSDGMVPANTEALLIWSIDCSARMHRILLAMIKAPGEQAIFIPQEVLIENAKTTPFVSFADPLSATIAQSLCANVK